MQGLSVILLRVNISSRYTFLPGLNRTPLTYVTAYPPLQLSPWIRFSPTFIQFTKLTLEMS